MAMTTARETGDLFGGSPQCAYLVTNRYNLLEMLSSGFAPTRAGFDKYYVDLTESRSGCAVLVAGPVPVGLCETVSADGASSFPVLVEFVAERLATLPTAALGSDGVSRTAVAGSPDVLAWAYARPLPLTWATRVHFRSDRDLREYSARRFENVPAGTLPSTVSPDLFAGSVDVEPVLAWIRDLPAGGPGPADYRRVDRRSGARVLAAAAVGPSVSALRGLTGFLGPAAAPVSVPEGAGWPEWVSGGATAGMEREFFAAAEAILTETDPDAGRRPLEVLEGVRSRLGTGQDELFRTTLAAMTAILRNDREFRPFAPGTGLSAAKALLLMLMRPEPDALLAWAAEETGADDEVRVGAATLSGLLHGRKRLSTSLRPESLDAYLAAQAAWELVPDPSASPAPSSPTVEEMPTDEGTVHVSVRWEGRELLARSVPAPGLIEILSTSDLAAEPGRGMALEVCRRMGWSDCVQTVAVGESATVSPQTAARGRGIRVVFDGFAEVLFELDVDGFRRRLSEAAIPPEVEKEVVGTRSDAAKTPRPTKKRAPAGRGKGSG